MKKELSKHIMDFSKITFCGGLLFIIINYDNFFRKLEFYLLILVAILLFMIAIYLKK